VLQNSTTGETNCENALESRCGRASAGLICIAGEDAEEKHVAEILRRAGVDSRTTLMARFWEAERAAGQLPSA
jgi:hypothetical protein